MPFVPTDSPDNLVPRGSFEGTGTRAFLHNMAANPGVARRYMASLGDQIRDYGNGNDWNWAWRKQDSDPWIPAASQGFTDFLLDHIADAATGVLTGLAATGSAALASETGPGAIAAGIAGGAAASGALEAGRQALGAASGIPQNLDVGGIEAATAGGALAEPLGAAGGVVIRGAGRLAGATLRGAGKLLPEIAAKVADIQPLGASGLPGRSAGEALMEGARLTQGGRIPLIDPDLAGGVLRGAVAWINRVRFPEIIKADAKVSGSNAAFDLTRAMRTIEDRTVEGVARTARIQRELGSSKTLRSDAADLLARIRAATGYAGDWAQTPGNVALTVKGILQDEAAGKGAYAGAGPSRVYGSIVKRAAAQTRAAIETTMQQIDPAFSLLMKEAAEKTRILGSFNNKLRMADKGLAGQQAASAWVRGVFGENKIAYLNALNELDAHFSTGLRGRLVDRAIVAIRQANIGAQLGNRGLGELVPRITGGGHVRTAAAVVGGGYLAGGPFGALAGAVAASPKFILRAAGPVAAAGQAAQSAAGALARVHLGGATRVVATGALDTASVGLLREAIRSEGGGSKGLVRQEEGARPRRIVRIGP